jgi:hypothetical protein
VELPGFWNSLAMSALFIVLVDVDGAEGVADDAAAAAGAAAGDAAGAVLLAPAEEGVAGLPLVC